MTIKLTRLDMDFILTQIQLAEAGQIPVNPLLSFGLRTVDGIAEDPAAGRAVRVHELPAVGALAARADTGHEDPNDGSPACFRSTLQMTHRRIRSSTDREPTTAH